MLTPATAMAPADFSPQLTRVIEIEHSDAAAAKAAVAKHVAPTRKTVATEKFFMRRSPFEPARSVASASGHPAWATCGIVQKIRRLWRRLRNPSRKTRIAGS